MYATFHGCNSFLTVTDGAVATIQDYTYNRKYQNNPIIPI